MVRCKVCKGESNSRRFVCKQCEEAVIKDYFENPRSSYKVADDWRISHFMVSSILKRNGYIPRGLKSANTGPKNGNWSGGDDGLRAMNPIALLRDNCQCQRCYMGLDKLKRNNLHVHHIDKNPKNNRLENLITLCRSCHQKLHRLGGK